MHGDSGTEYASAWSTSITVSPEPTLSLCRMNVTSVPPWTLSCGTTRRKNPFFRPSVRRRRIGQARTRRRARDERDAATPQDRATGDVLLAAREAVDGEHVPVRAKLDSDRRGDLRVQLRVGLDRLQLRALERPRHTWNRPPGVPVGQEHPPPVPLVETCASAGPGIGAGQCNGREPAVRSRRARDARRIGCRDRRGDGADSSHGRDRYDDGFLHRHALLRFPRFEVLLL